MASLRGTQGTEKDQKSILDLIDSANKKGSRSPSQQAFNGGSVLTEEKFSRIFKNLSVIAQKTYQVVPQKTCWSLTQILTEMGRKGFNHEKRAITDSLDELVKAGVIQNKSGMYVKAKVTGGLTVVATEKKEERKEEPVLDQLFKIAGELEEMHTKSGRLFTALRDLSLQLYEEHDQLKDLADNAEKAAREKIMKKFLEA